MLTDEQVHKLLHDLRGPTISARGFTQELARALGCLKATLGAETLELPADTCEGLQRLFHDDLDPCLEHLNASLTRLQERLDVTNSQHRGDPKGHAG